MATPEGRPAELHLYRISSIPTLYGSHIQHPICLTCSEKSNQQKTETPITLEKSWYDENDDILDSESVSMHDFLTEKNENNNKGHPSSDCLYHSVIFPETSSAKYVL